MLLSRIFPSLLVVIPLICPAAEEEFFTAPFGPGGKWNLYQVRTAEVTWAEAHDLAEKADAPGEHKGKKGHLIACTTPAESSFAHRIAIGKEVWIGLTDSEDFGGKEAGAARTEGWRWVTGEPVTWTDWAAGEPNESSNEGGEDGVSLATNGGKWNDGPNGKGGQSEWHRQYIIEWEIGADQPVKDATALERVLPAAWKVDHQKPAAEGSGPWAGWSIGPGGNDEIDGRNLRHIISALEENISGAPDARFDVLDLHYANNESEISLFGKTNPFPHAMHTRALGALYTATIRITEPQDWSFLICADDFVAVRIPGQRWKASHRDGFIDPLDPETLCQENPTFSACMLGTINLPVGDHRIEVVFGNSMLRSAVSVMAAPGTWTLPGATDTWRVPGWKAKGKLHWPGVSADGWRVQHTKGEAPGAKWREYTIMDAAEAAEAAADSKPLDAPAVNFIDEAAPGTLYFPGAVPRPGESPGQEEFMATSASATLVIPEDGTWFIGFASDEMGALSIEGQRWDRLVRNIRDGKITEDVLTVPRENGTWMAGEITLKKGEYPIHFLHSEKLGPTVMSVFGAPAGYPPRLLTKDGAGSSDDIDGLPLVPQP